MTPPAPDTARVVTVDASWVPGRPPTGPTAFLATASGLHPAGAHGALPDVRGTDVPGAGARGAGRAPRRGAAARTSADTAATRTSADTAAASTVSDTAATRTTSDGAVVRDAPVVLPELHLAGTVLPAFADAHVHLGLVDATALVPHGIAAVHDLGWIPDAAAGWAAEAGRSAGASRLPDVLFAGAFLTAPGGYPSDRSWAPAGSVVEVATPADAVAAVDRQAAAGASCVKVALNAVAGPVPDDATLAALVARAHERGVPVVAHSEGPGQAERAFAAGVDRLAHAPFSERLPDALLAAMAGASHHDGTSAMTWVSTLDIHGWGAPTPEHDVAVDNVRRFVAAGGTVVYGTDLGNGPLPVGVNARELRALAAAGLGPDALLRALTSGPPRRAERRVPAREMRPGTHPSRTDAALATLAGAAVTFVPGPPPDVLTGLTELAGRTDPAGRTDRAGHADRADLDRLDVGALTRWLSRATTLHLADVLHPGFVPPSATTTRKDQP